jgi:hypothetical protein
MVCQGHRQKNKTTFLHLYCHLNSDLCQRNLYAHSIDCPHTDVPLSMSAHHASLAFHALEMMSKMRKWCRSSLQDIVTIRRRGLAACVCFSSARIMSSVHFNVLVTGIGPKEEGRPVKTWRAACREDMATMGVSLNGVAYAGVANDRAKWRNLVPNVPKGTERFRSKQVDVCYMSRTWCHRHCLEANDIVFEE